MRLFIVIFKRKNDELGVWFYRRKGAGGYPSAPFNLSTSPICSECPSACFRQALFYSVYVATSIALVRAESLLLQRCSYKPLLRLHPFRIVGFNALISNDFILAIFIAETRTRNNRALRCVSQNTSASCGACIFDRKERHKYRFVATVIVVRQVEQALTAA